jgi:hypothetical protein
MDGPIQQTEPANPTKNIIITILLILLVFSLLGINLLNIFGNIFQKIIDIFNPVISKTLADLGYSSGNIISQTSDLAADASKQGIDILNGTFHSVGDLLVKASEERGYHAPSALDIAINRDTTRNKQPPMVAPEEPRPNGTTNPIQSPANAKYKWCLVGEYNGGRGCVSVTDADKCLSGKIYPSKAVCWNPNISA